jgi:hypothetical protein
MLPANLNVRTLPKNGTTEKSTPIAICRTGITRVCNILFQPVSAIAVSHARTTLPRRGSVLREQRDDDGPGSRRHRRRAPPGPNRRVSASLCDRLGDNLRALPRARGLNQIELAARCHWNHRLSSTLENGDRNASRQTRNAGHRPRVL